MSSIWYAVFDLRKCVCMLKDTAWAAFEKHAGCLTELILLARWAFELMASVVYTKVWETLPLWVSIIFLSAFHISHVLLPLQTQLWLKMELLIFHPVSLLLSRFPTTMTFSSFSLQSLLFAVSFLPPYLTVTSLSWNHRAGKKKI